MKKNIFLATLLMVGSLSCLADDYQYLTLTSASGEKSVELASIQKITFDAENVNVITAQGTTSLPLSEMEKMYFSATPTAIKALPTQSEGLSVKRGILQVNGEGLLHIYGSNGALLQMANIQGQSTISLKNLPKGLYIISLGDQTIKVNK